MPNLINRKYYCRAYHLASTSTLMVAFCSSIFAKEVVNTDLDYTFDSSLMRGSAFNLSNLDRFNQSESIAPGQYRVDLFINNLFIKKLEVIFIKDPISEKVKPCFSMEQLTSFGVKKPAIITSQQLEKEACIIPERGIKGATSSFDYSKLSLHLSIPQISMDNLPRGYVAPEMLDTGVPVVFVNYNANQYHVSYKGDSHLKNSDSSYINMNIGANLGLWRYRQQTFFTKQSGVGSNIKTTNHYVQRSILPLQSELLLGESFTSGQYFSGIGFKGFSLKSDDRMLPDSRRGYAPSIRGTAKTNANIVVRQGNNIIYQTTVPPGPFEINDLYATNYAGDLTVTVNEADGTMNTFTVPYSAIPDSLRPGVTRYDFTVGEARYTGKGEKFGELTFRRGLTNAITLNTGLRIADDYQALLFGGVYTNQWGAFGATTTFSNTKLLDKTETGWMSRLSYSRTFQPTDTTITLANYHYSTSGYRDLNDVFGIRRANRKGYQWDSSTYLQKSRFDVSLNQSLGDYGNIFLNGAIQDYYGQRQRDTQLQASYGKSFRNGVAINLSVTRSKYGAYSIMNGSYDIYQKPSYIAGRSQTTAAFSVSIPLGYTINSPTLSSSITHDSESGTDVQSSINGTLGEKQTASYGVTYSTNSKNHIDTWNGNIQNRFSMATLSLSAANSDHYWQVSQGIQGSIVLHEGGVTLGPYLGETFGIIEAKGATGSEVLAGQGSKVDYFGYALIPYLAPYRYNTVILSPENMRSTTEFVSNQKQIAPYAGIASKIQFDTIIGYPVLFSLTSANNTIPMGAAIYDREGKEVGMVGQGMQAYARLAKEKGKLMVQWGKNNHQQCQVDYNLKGLNTDEFLITVNAKCI